MSQLLTLWLRWNINAVIRYEWNCHSTKPKARTSRAFAFLPHPKQGTDPHPQHRSRSTHRDRCAQLHSVAACAPFTRSTVALTGRQMSREAHLDSGKPSSRNVWTNMSKLPTLKPRLALIATQRIPSQQTERLRGRAAVDRRARWLRTNPLCVDCDKQGRVTAGQVVDHIIPLWKGGADDYEANGQTLCIEHHDAKSKIEAAERASGYDAA